MSTRRPHRIDRKTAERLLRGEPVDSGTGLEGLVDVLAAAAAPARDGELSGEQAAMAAFRDAQTVPASKQRRPSMIKSALAKLLSAKILATAAATTAASGVVLAASTGHLPESLGGGSSTPATSHPTPHATGGPSARPTTHASHEANGTPSPSLEGLCHAYNAGVRDNPGKALDNPAFSVLISTAGGKDKVGSYCATVLGDDKGHKPSTHPTGSPDSHPTGRGSDHPTGAPSGAPTEHQGGGDESAHPTPTHPGPTR